MKKNAYRLQTDEVRKRYPAYYWLATWYRNRRVRLFLELFRLSGNEKILDVGGTVHFWQQIDVVKNITILNVQNSVSAGCQANDRVEYKLYDGDRFPFDDNEFDVVFSNSTIEHVGDFQKKQKFAKEITRVGRSFFLQTPSFWFPYEPHAMFPLFQFMPGNLQIRIQKLLSRSPYSVEELLSIKLLTRGELQYLFPGAEIMIEKFFFFPKSYYVFRLSNEAG